MNWLDIVLLVALGFGAFRGFRNGFIIELCSLLGLLLGIWGAVHFSNRVAVWLGPSENKIALAFLVTFVAVVVLVALLGRALTKAIDLAQLTLPNKVTGIIFGVLRMAFLLSVLLNVGPIRSGGRTIPDARTCEGSALYAPLRSVAPFIIPALGESKWVKHTIEQVKEEGKELVE